MDDDAELVVELDDFLDVLEGLVGNSDSFWASLNWPEIRPLVNLAIARRRFQLAAEMAAEWALFDEDMYFAEMRPEVESVIALVEAVVAEEDRALPWKEYPFGAYAELRRRDT